MRTKAIMIFGLLALIVALPIAMRRETATADPRCAQDRLIILSPHNESIREEFCEAFAAHWKETRGRRIHIDWRSPGGTSEIRMMLDAGFKAAEGTGRIGIGVDVFFGGGEPDFASQAKKNRLTPLRVFDSHPEYFTKDGPIPDSFTGEMYYPPDHVWVGVCLSQFGICYNPDFVKRLNLPFPATWRDLAAPEYAGSLALGDPTKSGSVARAFELLVQAEMLRALAEHPDDREAALQQGWQTGLQLIQRLAANARYFTDSASKIPHDVGQGNAAAGMCIDLYGHSYAHELKKPDGSARVVWIAPRNGTTLSADPVAVLKGAPNPEAAQSFVEFCLSRQSQTIWFGKPGTPGGPLSRALHRTPIRRDLYAPEFLQHSTMPNTRPYEDPGNFTYQKDLTGAAFNTLRQIVKVMCIDSHEEMKSAWSAMRKAGMPPDALAVFSDMSIIPYTTAGRGDPGFSGTDPLQTAAHAARIGGWFRANYRKAQEMAGD
jgi:iron(III) transport system substrate-binding protein